MKLFDWFLVIVGALALLQWFTAFIVNTNLLAHARRNNPVGYTSFVWARRIRFCIFLLCVGILTWRFS